MEQHHVGVAEAGLMIAAFVKIRMCSGAHEANSHNFIWEYEEPQKAESGSVLAWVAVTIMSKFFKTAPIVSAADLSLTTHQSDDLQT